MMPRGGFSVAPLRTELPTVMRHLAYSIQNYLHNLGGNGWWRVCFELLLIGLFVHYVLKFVRGTRGARMLRGVAFLLIGLWVLVSVAAVKLHLEEISFLYGKFLTFASFAVVVVFAPELRRALMRVGETRFFRRFSDQVSDEVDALVEVANFCSKRKIGALIAIERDVALGAVAESGTKIDADLSADLLNTIFWPNSPLHDLGVILSGGRVAHAAVQFPLAESGELERELGSRHRAAVGMSQESDAVVLVVSEETGDVSIAERGVLHRRIPLETLGGVLLDLLGRTSAPADAEDEPTGAAEKSPRPDAPSGPANAAA